MQWFQSSWDIHALSHVKYFNHSCDLLLIFEFDWFEFKNRRSQILSYVAKPTPKHKKSFLLFRQKGCNKKQAWQKQLKRLFVMPYLVGQYSHPNLRVNISSFPVCFTDLWSACPADGMLCMLFLETEIINCSSFIRILLLMFFFSLYISFTLKDRDFRQNTLLTVMQLSVPEKLTVVLFHRFVTTARRLGVSAFVYPCRLLGNRRRCLGFYATVIHFTAHVIAFVKRAAVFSFFIRAVILSAFSLGGIGTFDTLLWYVCHLRTL